MTVTKEQNGLIIDYFFRCSDQDQIERGSALIASNSQAAKLYSCIQQTLARLEHIKSDSCPNELAEVTIARLKLSTPKKSSQQNKRLN